MLGILKGKNSERPRASAKTLDKFYLTTDSRSVKIGIALSAKEYGWFDVSGPIDAGDVSYDGSAWATPVSNVQEALDYLYANLSGSGVMSVTGLNTDNTDPLNPIVQISVDGVTVTGNGTPGSPLVAASGVTPAALTKTDDTNVTLTLGGSPSTALLAATSLTLGWTGTLADGRIASAATWNAKQTAYTILSTLGALADASGVLTNNGAGVLSWAAAASGTVTSVGVSSTDLSVSGSPITTSGSITLNVNNNAITYAKFQQVAALSVVGNSTNALANAAAISAGSDYQILRRSGTAIGFGSIDLSQSNAVGTSRLAYSNLTQLAGLSVLGVTGTSTANVAAITGTANQVLVVNGAGTSLAFGQVNLSSPSARSGTLPATNGGTGINSWTTGELIQATASNTLSALSSVSAGSYLRSGGVTTASSWSTLKLPNTATQYYIPYATAANTIGESGNLQFSGTNLGIGVAGTSKVHVLTASIGVTQSDAYGILLANSTAAAAGAQQMSPPIVMQGNGWKTNATAASQDVRFRMDVLPVQAAANPTGIWELGASINGGAYSNVLTVTSAGVLSTSGNISSGNNASIAFNLAATRVIFGGNTTTTINIRTTNGGSNIAAPFIFDNGAASGAVAIAYTSTEQLAFVAGNSGAANRVMRAAIQITNLTNTAGSEVGDLAFLTQSGGTAATQKMRISGLGNVVLGNEAALATNATNGFAYIPTCAGTPTGVPTAYTGKVAMVFDTTNSKLYIYNGGWLGGTVPGAFT